MINEGVDIVFLSGESVRLPPHIFYITNYGSLHRVLETVDSTPQDVKELPAPLGISPKSLTTLVEYYNRFEDGQHPFTQAETDFVAPHAEELLIVANALDTRRLFFLAREIMAKRIPQMPTELIIQWLNIRPPDFLQQL